MSGSYFVSAIGWKVSKDLSSILFSHLFVRWFPKMYIADQASLHNFTVLSKLFMF